MSNQQPPTSRPWLRLTSVSRPIVPPPPTTPAAQPTTTITPTAATPVPPPVGSPPLRPVATLPTFVRPPVPELTRLPLPPVLAPPITPMATPSPERQPTAKSASVRTTPIQKPVAPSASSSPTRKRSPSVSPSKTKVSSPIPDPSLVAALLFDTKPPKIIMPEVESPPPSPVLKPVAPPPPSPLKLPPPQIKAPDEDVTPKILLEAEQKNVLFQKSVAVPERENWNGDMIRSVGARKPGIAAATVKEANDVAASTGTGNGIIAKKKVESGEAGVKVIMMASENKGATMELTHPAKNHRYKIGNKDSSSSDEGKHGREHKGKAPTTASLPTATYTNSNVQGVNNSILYKSSCTHHDPGVHFSLTRKPAEGAFPHMKENKA